MKTYFETDRGRLYHGDCLEIMRELEAESISAVLTDPPYGLSFMGKKWDYDVPNVGIWRECLRILKPGVHALIFAGSRTQHRMAVNVEDAGFILKDCLMWIYGSGFPKSTDISKKLDLMAGKEREVVCDNPNERNSDHLKKTAFNARGKCDITAPATPEAEAWNGWGTHLKPAYEPVLLAMKPNDGTYAANALKHGVAGLNIDGGRIETEENLNGGGYSQPTGKANIVSGDKRTGAALGMNDHNKKVKTEFKQPKGRFPANVILDEEAARLLDEQSGVSKSTGGKKDIVSANKGGLGDQGGASRFFYCAKASKAERNEGCEGLDVEEVVVFSEGKAGRCPVHGNSNPSGLNTYSCGCQIQYSKQRKEIKKQSNSHPTVKPLKLVQYLCNLLKTPTGGTILDPFGGSGTTALAAHSVGMGWILCEMEEEYCEIAAKRIESAASQKSFEDYL